MLSYKASVAAIKFGILSPDLIRKMSVAEIQNPDTYDEDGMPIPTGVMDPRLGTLEPGQRCKTCGNTYLGCPGHFGHIELPVPVIHVGFAKTIHMLLKATCRVCGRILLSDAQIKMFREELEEEKKLGKTFKNVYYKVLQKVASTQVCPHCGEKQYRIELEKPTTFIEITPSEAVRLSASAVRARLERIPDDDLVLLGIDPEVARPEWMVLTVLPVPPVYVRPSITLESGFRSEDDLTHKLVDILRVVQRLRENIAAGAPSSVIAELADLLQYHVTTYINNEAVGISPAVHRSGRVLKTLTQRLKGKEGRFRLNLSGKRVDFSARTVISPDPNIGINEVGVPIEIAMQLTVPEKVTIWNIEKLKEYVRNGPDKYPGAKYVIRPDGKRIRLKLVHNLEEVANALEPGYIVERHLMDGDIVLFNRQPSLHRMSIMAHIVKVLPYKTFRLNLAVCTPYNADFDGDEMNLHVPQSEEAQTEARELLLVQNNIISPRYGAPIIGAIRDFLTSMYLLTKDDTLLTLKEVSYLLAAIEYDGELPEPVVKEPVPMWSGKQIFSLLLPKGFYHRFRSSFYPEEEVVIEDGKLIKGVIDKSGVGVEKANSIVHRLAKDYGSDVAREFLDKVVKLANTYLNVRGFTFGIDDLTVPSNVYQDISKIFEKMDEEFLQLKSDYEKGKIQVKPGETPEQAFESAVLSILQKARDTAGKIVRRNIPITSSAVIMTRSGARGTPLNIDQMIAVVGQQAVRRERIKRGFTDRVLTFFKPKDLSPAARGFVYSSFVKGLNPIEFFFHMVGGRDGLVDTAVRTQQSGYMQRRLVNALESLYVEYDGTVRTADEKRIIQFRAGEDGVDPAKSDSGQAFIPSLIVERAMKLEPAGKPATLDYINSKANEYMELMPEKLVKDLVSELVKTKASINVVNKAFEEAYRCYLKSQYEPGDAVGVITAQSIGEPSTQLTLRTFHFAGVREQSILLGLPRLIEIVDATREPSTPIMKIYLQKDIATDKAKAQKVANQILHTAFKEIVSEVVINYKRGTLTIYLDMDSMKEKGVTMNDVMNALKPYKPESKEQGVVTIKPPEATIQSLEKLKDRILNDDKMTVKGIKKITKVIISQEDGEYVILTEGSNLKDVLKVPGIDPTRVMTNNIQEIAEVLGIEAARNAIVNEIKNVLREQGLDVDIRHILLLADMMTVSGRVKQVGRHGVVKLKEGVLARAAFEISVQVLLDAAAKGDTDYLKGSVERILLGKEIPIGTGMVSLMMLHPAKKEENQAGENVEYKEGA